MSTVSELSKEAKAMSDAWEKTFPSTPTEKEPGVWHIWTTMQCPGEGWEYVSCVGIIGQMQHWRTKDKAVVDAWFAARANEEFISQPSV
jgi:hypothetical protein